MEFSLTDSFIQKCTIDNNSNNNNNNRDKPLEESFSRKCVISQLDPESANNNEYLLFATHCIDRDIAQSKISVIYKCAVYYYQKCLQNWLDVPSPVEWFTQQNKMNQLLVDYEKFFNFENDYFRQMFFIQNPLVLYLGFMRQYLTV